MAGDKNHTARRAAGYAFAAGPCGTVEADTLQCGHCGRHWTIQPGSGRQRGFCLLCMKPTCGPHCLVGDACVSQEQMIENMERGRSLDFRPIVVRNPGLPEG